MPRVPVDRLSPGWHVASNVYNQSGLILLAAGTKLTASYIDRLRELEVPAVDVQLAQFDGVHQRDILSPRLRSQAATAVQTTLESVRRHGDLDPAPVIPYVDHIISQVTRNHDVLIGLTDIRAHDAYTHAHSVNVCMLATMIGKSLGYRRPALEALGTDAILHDLGKVFVEPRVLNKRGPLTPDEFEQVKRHTVVGYKALAAGQSLPHAASLISLQHHERLDGTGYPCGLRGRQLSAYARVVAVADVYDAITSDRPYRPALTPLECIRLLRESEAGRLCPRAVAALVARVAPYPVGSMVRLAGGELAVVTKCGPNAPDRPELVLFADPDGVPLPEPQPVRLVENPGFAVREIVTLDDLSDLVAGTASAETGLGELVNPTG